MLKEQFRLKGPEIKFDKSTEPDTIVVFMHGYGANGDDLIELSHEFNKVLPNAVYVSPHAPFPFEMAASADSYQWCSLKDFNDDILNAELDHVYPILEDYLQTLLTRFALPSDRLVLIGFSQGAFTALNTALYTHVKPRAIIGYSGGFVENKNRKIFGQPEICLIHGDMDDVLSVDNIYEAKIKLDNLNVSIETHVCTGLGHGISQDGIKIGKEFLSQIFYPPQAQEISA